MLQRVCKQQQPCHHFEVFQSILPTWQFLNPALNPAKLNSAKLDRSRLRLCCQSR
ncbi:hypothetical protein H1R20_g4054, partial [Candolleomyces eurysporus]